METLFNRRCLEVLHASTVKDFTNRIVEFTQSVGFGTVAAIVVTDHTASLTEFQTVTNAPAPYMADFENLELGRLDPVSQHCKRSSVPIVWDERTYKSPEQKILWERQAAFGYRSGFAVATHLGRGRHFMFGADWDEDRCERVANYKEILRDFLDFAAHAQAAAFELCLPARVEPDSAQFLANVELEALRWTMDGKTSWEVANHMSISERHVTLLLRRAMQKLGCSTKYETGLRAIRLGLISCQ